MFFLTLTFATPIYCKSNQELLTVDNNSSHSVHVYTHFVGTDNPYPVASILKSGDRKVLNISTLAQDCGIEGGQLSHITITLNDAVKANNHEGLCNKGFLIKKNFSIKNKAFSSPIRITDAIMEYLKLN